MRVRRNGSRNRFSNKQFNHLSNKHMPQDSSAFVMAIGSIGPAIAIGLIGAAAMLAIARNPQVAERIQMAMVIAIAFAEAIAIYSLVVSLIIKFV